MYTAFGLSVYPATKLFAVVVRRITHFDVAIMKSVPLPPPYQFPIPDRLKSVLEGDAALHGYVDDAFKRFAPIMASGRLQLFPEYSDHGYAHLGRVLGLCDYLIPDDMLDELSPRDVAVLAFAVLLHDSAMHLTMDQFLLLLQEPWNGRRVSYFDDRRWNSAWQEYFDQARHWSELQLLNIFGNRSAEVAGWNLAEPRQTPRNLTDDIPRRLAGEFIRRHHPRMAHLFGRYGVPLLRAAGDDESGGDQTRIMARKIRGPDDFPELGDLAGAIGRSHGLPLRRMYGYFRETYDDQLCRVRGTHPLYLMGLLRIADYLDLYAERAPGAVLQVSPLRSPLSQQEWQAHGAIVEITPWERDESCLYVVARPTKASSWLHLRKWISGINRELAETVGELAENYGHASPFRLDVRRVKSNVEDDASLLPHVNFALNEARMEADTKVLPLLAKPLYGNMPGVGVRELLQNSLDAVRELKTYTERNSIDLTRLNFPQLVDRADIELALCKREEDWPPPESEIPRDWTHWFQIRDRGIGMTPSTVRDYYLRAGASFRNSDAWTKAFTDGHGKSVVARSGRFGIGALATALLGDEVIVTTKHVDPKSRPLRFRPTMDGDNVELTFAPDATPIGTTISVRITPEIYTKLQIAAEVSAWRGPAETRKSKETPDQDSVWDWYWGDDVKVVRILMPSGEMVQSQGSRETIKWLSIEPSPAGYRRVTWTWSTAMGAFHWNFCNGIYIGMPGRAGESVIASWWNDPSLMYDDHDGAAPLALSRFEFASTPSFMTDVIASMTENIAALFLMFTPNETNGPENFLSRQHPILLPYTGGVIFNRNGLCPATRYHFMSSPGRLRILLHENGVSDLTRNRRNLRNLAKHGDEAHPIAVIGPNVIWHRIEFKSKPIELLAGLTDIDFDYIAELVVTSRTGEIKPFLKDPSTATNEVASDETRNLPSLKRFSLMPRKLEAWIAGRTVRTSGQLKELVEISSVRNILFGKDPPLAVLDVVLDKVPEKSIEPEVKEVWERLGLPMAIPYDLKERERLCRSAYDQLGKHVEYWREIAARENATPFWDPNGDMSRKRTRTPRR
jgi:hypothetical protein